MSGKLDFAVSVAAKLQAWLEQETGVAYSLPKQGQRVSSLMIW